MLQRAVGWIRYRAEIPAGGLRVGSTALHTRCRRSPTPWPVSDYRFLETDAPRESGQFSVLDEMVRLLFQGKLRDFAFRCSTCV